MTAARAVIGGAERHLCAWQPSRLRLRAIAPDVDLAALPMKHAIAGFPTDFDQGQLGSCGPNSVAEVYKHEFGVMFSRLFLYWNTRSVEGDPELDSGVEIPDMLTVAHTMGMPLESDWEYDVNAFQLPPPRQAYTDAVAHRVEQWDVIAGLDHLLLELSKNQPVTFGFQVPASMEDGAGGVAATTGLVNVPSSTDPAIGGHCVNAFGFDRAQRRVKATCHYGPSFGDGGCIWLPFEFFTTGAAMDLSAIRRIS